MFCGILYSEVTLNERLTEDNRLRSHHDLLVCAVLGTVCRIISQTDISDKNLRKLFYKFLVVN